MVRWWLRSVFSVNRCKLSGRPPVALNYLFGTLPLFAACYFPNGLTRSALLKAPAVAFGHFDDMHQTFLQ
ncbi:MAG: HTH-type transcriptional regulator ArgP [Sodalis sp.]|nr:MAG: HTH-type transcriptional regulator ArgP [Sodalis sp.]